MKTNPTYEANPPLTSLFQVLFSLLAILFIAETLVMFILPSLHLQAYPVVENFADAFLLAVLCAPFIWMLISGRKQAEEALQAERQRLFSVLENLPGFVCLKAPDYSLSFTNRYFRECFGEVEGRPCYQVLRDRQEPCDPCPTVEVFAKRELKAWEWDGRDNRAYRIYDYPFTDLDGSPLVLALGIDISEQKHAEQELRASQAELITQHEELQDIHLQLENKSLDLETAYADLKATQSQMLQREKMASIGLLAAGVAHEINNPMGFISSNLVTLGKYTERLVGFINAQAELLKSPGSGEKLAELEEQRRRIKLDYISKDVPQLIEESLDGAERVKKIVQNLKAFSRVDDTERTQVDLNECLDSTINIAWNEIKYVATLKKEYGTLPPLLCYPQQLNQVFMNLLVNAAHAIEGQGEITVRTWAGEEHVWVAVSDTGTGIPEEIRGRIFEPFFTTKEVGKGTGLGLSISYDIVKKHGGEILVESEQGKGTTLTLKLPAARG